MTTKHRNSTGGGSGAGGGSLSRPAPTMLPEMHAFCRDLLRWFELCQRRKLRVGFRQEAKRILALRTEEVLANGRELCIDVEPDHLKVSGIPIRNVEGRGDIELAQHLYALQVRSILLKAGTTGQAFVQFMERCSEEAPGPGTRRALGSAAPDSVELEMDAYQPPEVEEVEVEPEPEVVEDEPAESLVEALPPLPVEPAEMNPEVVDAVDAAVELLLEADPDDREAFGEVVELYAMIVSEGMQHEGRYTIRRVAESGERLLRDKKMATWLGFLRFLALEVPRERSLNGLQFSLQVLSLVGESRQVAAFFQFLTKEGAAVRDLLRDYLEIVPASSVDTVARYAAFCPALNIDSSGPDRDLLLSFVIASGDNLDGLGAMASHPEARLARLAVDAVASLTPEVGEAIIRRALQHPTVAIRYDAVRAAQCLPVSTQSACLPDALADSEEAVRKQAAWILSKCCVPRAIRPVINEVTRPEFADRSVDEQVLFFRALATTARPEALYAIERRLAPARPGLKQRLAKSFFGSQSSDPVRERLLQTLAEMEVPQVQEIVRRAQG